MREILFRGKRTDGVWEFGYYFAKPIQEKHFILCGENQWMVCKESVGQFTGLTDKNGKKIFDGDIIEWFAQGESEHPDFGYIEYDEQSFAWRVCWQKYDPDWLEGMQSQYITVIGNIFDNKDLLS